MGNITVENQISQLKYEDSKRYQKIKKVKNSRYYHYYEYKIDNVIKIQNKIKQFLTKLKFNNYTSNLREIVKQKLIAFHVPDPKQIINNNEAEKLQQKYIRNNPNTPLFQIPKQNLKYSFHLPMNNFIKNEYYIGDWNIDSKYHGYGILYIDNNKYEGNFRNGKLNGKGIVIYSDIKVVLKGDWTNNLLNGKGEEYYIGDSNEFVSYNGTFLKGKRSFGKLLWKDTSYYEGGFNQNNKFNGYGKCYWNNLNEMYEGEWVDGNIHGKGKYYYQNGSTYEGDYNMNKRHGYGQYIWNKTKYYVGGWKDDLQSGEGVYCKEGIVVRGIWRKGKLINKAINLTIDEKSM